MARPKTLWGIVAVLAGVVLFGVAVTLMLLKKQAELSASIAELSKELQDTQVSLKKAEDRIQEDSLAKAQLEEDLEDFKFKLSKAEKKLDQFREYARYIRNKMDNATEINEALASRNRDINERLVRMELENQELRLRFRDPAFLRQTLRELRSEKRKPQQKPAVPVRPSRSPILKKTVTKTVLPAERPAEANEGYLIRDGQSTIMGLVDIRVMPAETVSAR